MLCLKITHDHATVIGDHLVTFIVPTVNAPRGQIFYSVGKIDDKCAVLSVPLNVLLLKGFTLYFCTKLMMF